MLLLFFSLSLSLAACLFLTRLRHWMANPISWPTDIATRWASASVSVPDHSFSSSWALYESFYSIYKHNHTHYRTYRKSISTFQTTWSFYYFQTWQKNSKFSFNPPEIPRTRKSNYYEIFIETQRVAIQSRLINPHKWKFRKVHDPLIERIFPLDEKKSKSFPSILMNKNAYNKSRTNETPETTFFDVPSLIWGDLYDE